MKIPVEFELFGETIKIVWDNEKCDTKQSYGHTEYRTNEIFICDVSEGIPLDKKHTEVTFLHEVVHYILRKTEYSKLCNDEKFVALFSRALHQFLTTQKFKK